MSLILTWSMPGSLLFIRRVISNMKKKLIQKKTVKTPRLNSSEVNFIYDICKWYLGKENKILIPEGIRHRVIFDYLRKNGCTGIFFEYLDNTAIQIPGELMESYRAEYLSIEMKNTIYMKVAERVDKMCRDSNIDYVLMKGAALIEAVYKDKGVRPLSDIDLIVASREDALRLIERLNGEKHSGENFISRRYKDHVRMSCFVYPGGFDRRIEIEIYFPVEDSYYPLPELFFNNAHRLFKNARRINHINTPDSSLHFLILLVHLVHHHLGSRLIWYLDMAVLVDEYLECMEWDFIISECKRLEFKNILFYILQMLKTNFRLKVPEAVLKEAGSTPAFNDGFLKEMVSARNVIMDSFGGGKVWQYPALSLNKFMTIIYYGGIPVSSNDQPYKWYTLNWSSKRKKRIMGDLASVLFFKHKYSGRKTIFKKMAGGFITLLFSLISLPFHLYYNLKNSS